MVERVLAVAHGETVESYSTYNILTNNCEHFASWARSGWSVSCQVAHRTSQVMKLAMVAGAAFLPRPVSVLGKTVDKDSEVVRFDLCRRSVSCWSPHGGRYEEERGPGG